MSENFYLGLKARIEAGQYTMAEITAELDKRLGQGRITDEAYSELLTLAETCIDPNYNGNKMPTVFSRVLARSAIGDSYVRMILEGRRTFSSVHPTKQQEEIDPDFSVNPEEVPVE